MEICTHDLAAQMLFQKRFELRGIADGDRVPKSGLQVRVQSGILDEPEHIAHDIHEHTTERYWHDLPPTRHRSRAVVRTNVQEPRYIFWIGNQEPVQSRLRHPFTEIRTFLCRREACKVFWIVEHLR